MAIVPRGDGSVEGAPPIVLERRQSCFRATVGDVEHFDLVCEPATLGRVKEGIVVRSLGRELKIQGGRFLALMPNKRSATITYSDVAWVAEPHPTKGLLFIRDGEVVGQIRRNKALLSAAANATDVLVLFAAGFIQLGHAWSLPWSHAYYVNFPMPYRKFPRC